MRNELQDILSVVTGYMPNADVNRVVKAFEYNAQYFVDRVNPHGTSYSVHAVETARTVCRLKLDVSSLCAVFLHDIVREKGPEALLKIFDEDSVRLAAGVAALERVQFSAGRVRQADDFKKMLVSMSRDIRVLLVKLADRLQEMREIEFPEEEASRRLAEETSIIYGPLAERMGISWLRTEMEDVSFRVLWPTEYADLKVRADERLAERQDFIKGVTGRISALLTESGMTGFEVFGRPKNLYGLFKKMRIQGITLEKVYDFVAFRVIVDKPADCWQVLGLVHNIWTPIPSRFKDFINVPKPNGYKSLHTSVFGPLGEPMEIQIRTWQMHRDAESGIAAHWSYKESGRVEVRDQERFNWLKQLVEWAGEFQNRDSAEGSANLVDEIRDNLFEDQVFIFTPQGDLRVLRLGATGLDFAYDVHTEVGNTCTGVRVNGRLVPLSTALVTGDVVEVMTSRQSRPKRDWLSFVVTSKARSKIRSFMLDEERREALEIGRQLLEKEFRKAGPHQLRYMKDFLVDDEKARKIVEVFRIGSRDELIRAIGHGKLEAIDVVKALIPGAQQDQAALEGDRFDLAALSGRNIAQSRNSAGIQVDGIDGMLVIMAGCCNPIPGDEITGFVTRGRGVTIHHSTCQSIVDADPERLLPARWTGGIKGAFNSPIRILAEDVPGVLAGMTREISDGGANIAAVSSRRLDNGRSEVNLILQVEDHKMLDTILRAVRRIKGVVEVERVRQAQV